MIEAKIIADSLGPFGDRITSYVLTFPRIVLAEFNTHRALSRNSASSRAIPAPKMLKMVQENPFIPLRWMKEHTGMQGTEYFTNQQEISNLIKKWLRARNKAMQLAGAMMDDGVTKQITNRLLEPFMWHTCIATATEWENFFALRAHPDAEIHIQALANKMLEEANKSTPKTLKPYEWHIPFGENIDTRKLFDLGAGKWWPGFEDTYETELEYDADPESFYQTYLVPAMRKIATARCARVSYLNFEGKDDYEADIKLYDRLLASGHMSPFEHCARAMSQDEYVDNSDWSGNFRGFIQLRKELPNENKKDERLIKRTT